MIAAVVLAAGVSRRMGDDNKLLLPFGGQTLVEHVVSTICRSRANPIYVVLGHQGAEIEKRLDNQIRPVWNPHWRDGMLTSIQAGVRAVREPVSGYMICMGDLPRMDWQDYNCVMDAFEKAAVPNPIAAPFFEGQRGTPVIFSTAWKSQILELRDAEGCRPIVQANKAHLVKAQMPDNRALADVDTPEDYRRFKGNCNPETV